MSSTYAAYYHHQFDYRQPQFAHHPSHPTYQPPHHPIESLDLQQSYPQDRHFDPQHHPYQARQPTSWDPPWLRQTTACQPSLSYEPDMYSPPPPWRHPTCWDLPTHWETPGQRPFHEVSVYDQPIQRQPLGPQQFDQPPAHRVSCWEPSFTATVAVNQPHQHYQHPRSDLQLQQPSPAPPVTAPLLASPLLTAAAVVPPLNMSPLAPSCSPDISGEEAELLENLPPPSVISPPCVPNVSGEEEALWDDEKEVDSVEEVKTVITSFNVARVASRDVEKMEKSSPDSARKEKPVQGCIEIECSRQLNASRIKILQSQIDLGDSIVDNASLELLGDSSHVRDVASMKHRSTSLDADARLIPPQNNTPCLGIGCVDKLSILALNFDNHIGPLLMIFDRDEEGRHFPIRCAFDPGGNSSPKLLFVKLFIVSWFPP